MQCDDDYCKGETQVFVAGSGPFMAKRT